MRHCGSCARDAPVAPTASTPPLDAPIAPDEPPRAAVLTAPPAFAPQLRDRIPRGGRELLEAPLLAGLGRRRAPPRAREELVEAFPRSRSPPWSSPPCALTAALTVDELARAFGTSSEAGTSTPSVDGESRARASVARWCFAVAATPPARPFRSAPVPTYVWNGGTARRPLPSAGVAGSGSVPAVPGSEQLSRLAWKSGRPGSSAVHRLK